MTILTRRATDADADVLASLNRDVQALHAAALPWRFKPPGAEKWSAEAAALLRSPNNLVFIGEVDTEGAGYAYAEIIRQPETPLLYARELVYLHHLSVSPAFRRQGLGGALLSAVRSAATSQGISLIALDVWTFNEGARSFFQRHGFTSYNERMWNR
jgi:ribosomal protein S18 acetylase RimI-like enzyme